MLLLLVVNAQAANDSGEILGDGPVPLYVLNNDAPGTTLSSVTQPDHGTAVIDGAVVIYTADQGYQGPDKFDYSTSGPGGGSFTVSLQVHSNSLDKALSKRFEEDPVFAAKFVADLKRTVRNNPEGNTAKKLGDTIRKLAAVDPWFKKRFTTMLQAATAKRSIDLYVFLGEDNLQGCTETGDFNGPDAAFKQQMAQRSNNTVLVLNCAVAGSSIVQWSSLDAPRHLSPSYLAAGRRLDWSNKCMASIDGILDGAGPGATVKGLVIALGENDARIVAAGGPAALIDDWQENLRQLVDLYRASYSADMTVLLLGLPELTGTGGSLLTAWQRIQQDQTDFRSYHYGPISTSGIATWDDGTPGLCFSDAGQRTLADRLVQGFLDPQTPPLGVTGSCSPATPCFPGSNERIEPGLCNERNFFRRGMETRRVLCDQHGNSLHALASACDGCIDLGSVAAERKLGIVTVSTGKAFTPTFHIRQLIGGRLVEPVPYDSPFTTEEPRGCGRSDRESSTFVLAPGSYTYQAESRLAEACDGDSRSGCGLQLTPSLALQDSYQRTLSLQSGQCLVVILGEDTEPPVTYSSIQRSVFTPNCALSGCHAGASPAQGMNLSASVSYNNIVGVPSGERPSLLRIDPGNPNDSYLLQKIAGTASVGSRMPRGRAPLSDALIQQVRTWIEQGALDN
jgi:hypothetical protein